MVQRRHGPHCLTLQRASQSRGDCKVYSYPPELLHLLNCISSSRERFTTLFLLYKVKMIREEEGMSFSLKCRSEEVLTDRHEPAELVMDSAGFITLS